MAGASGPIGARSVRNFSLVSIDAWLQGFNTVGLVVGWHLVCALIMYKGSLSLLADPKNMPFNQ